MTQKPVSAPPPPAAFGNHLGYRFTADVVELTADIQCSTPAPASQDWALQLWADDALQIAELPLGPLLTDDAGQISVSGTATARIPAGEQFHALSLSLVSGADGVYDRVHDRKAFTSLQRFQQPVLQGAVACHFGVDELVIDIDGIKNSRDVGNISGTLAVEVWSLDEPYTGDHWSGVPIASLIIGCLHGQSAWSSNHFVAHAAPLPAVGHLTLMLREWTPGGYVTRDYRFLERPANQPNAAESHAAQEPSESCAIPAIVPDDPPAILDEPLPVKGARSGLMEKVRRCFGW